MTGERDVGYPKVLPPPLQEALSLWHYSKDGRVAPHDDRATRDYGCPYCEDIVGAFLSIERSLSAEPPQVTALTGIDLAVQCDILEYQARMLARAIRERHRQVPLLTRGLMEQVAALSAPPATQPDPYMQSARKQIEVDRKRAELGLPPLDSEE